MNTRTSSSNPTARPTTVPRSTPNPLIPPAPKVLSPGQWMRAVSGFDAPFGFDRMPTVFG